MYLEKSVQAFHPGGTHQIAYNEFPGDPAKTVVCVHGLSRNARDFEWLAQALAATGYRVICPDMAGRGRSEKFSDPAFYNYPQYIADIQTVLADCGVTEPVDWIGTSMGGLLGMMLAGMPHSPIKKLVVNDIGPFIPAAALIRIKDYVGLNPAYHDWTGFEAAFRKRFQSFGLKTEAEWDFMAKISSERTMDGSYRMNYDPHIIDVMPAAAEMADVDLWSVWQLIVQPVLILHGSESDVLSPSTIHQMMQGKKATSVTFAGVGHAPALMSPDQIGVIKTWLQDK